MEYKDTVMTDEQIELVSEFSMGFLRKDIAEAQAEVSFKAGKDTGWKQGYENGMKDADPEFMKQIGRKEVVEIVNGFMVLHSPDSWRRHLEEWDLVGFYESGV